MKDEVCRQIVDASLAEVFTEEQIGYLAQGDTLMMVDQGLSLTELENELDDRTGATWDLDGSETLASLVESVASIFRP